METGHDGKQRIPAEEEPMTQDEKRLRLLSIFHYALGALAGLHGLFVLFAMIDITEALAEVTSLTGPERQRATPSFAFIIVAIWIFAALVITTGRFLARRRHYLFCLVMAAIECAYMPCGTVLAVFTIVVLMRDTVKQLFSAGERLASLEPAHT
jgi:hypothetical protein